MSNINPNALEGNYHDGVEPKSDSLDPSNALTKLLDSAIANAAREVTPEFGPVTGSRSGTPSEEELGSSLASTKKNKCIYSFERLLRLRGLSLIKSLTSEISLPEPSFWRTKSRSHTNGKENSSSGANNSKAHHSSNKKGNTHHKKTKESSSSTDKKFQNLGGIGDDTILEAKISELLDEADGDAEPEWGEIDVNTAMNIDMGQTVEDFERWKMQMRKEEGLQKGETISTNEEDSFFKQSGNEVDSFFSFVEPEKKNSDSVSSKGNALLGVPARPSNPEMLSKGSRFSSFFNENSTKSESPVQTELEKGSRSSTPSLRKSELGGSRFLSMMGAQSQNTNDSTDRSEPLLVPPTQNNNEPLNATNNSDGLKSNNDAFFMSLLNKKFSAGSQPSSPLVVNRNPVTDSTYSSPSRWQAQAPYTQPGVASQSATPNQHFMGNATLQQQPWSNQGPPGIPAPGLVSPITRSAQPMPGMPYGHVMMTLSNPEMSMHTMPMQGIPVHGITTPMPVPSGLPLPPHSVKGEQFHMPQTNGTYLKGSQSVRPNQNAIPSQAYDENGKKAFMR